MVADSDGSEVSGIECRQIAELLGDYFDGTLPRHVQEQIDWHIDGCAPCVAFLNTYRGTIVATRQMPDATRMPPELRKKLVELIRRERGSQEPGA